MGKKKVALKVHRGEKVAAPPAPWKVESVERKVSIWNVGCWEANVTVEGGTLVLTRLDGSDTWCADFSCTRDGYVLFAHGCGDRTTSKMTADGALAQALNRRVEDMTKPEKKAKAIEAKKKGKAPRAMRLATPEEEKAAPPPKGRPAGQARSALDLAAGLEAEAGNDTFLALVVHGDTVTVTARVQGREATRTWRREGSTQARWSGEEGDWLGALELPEEPECEELVEALEALDSAAMDVARRL